MAILENGDFIFAAFNQPAACHVERYDRLGAPAAATFSNGKCCALSPDASRAVYGLSTAPWVALFSTADWSAQAASPPASPVNGLAFSPGGQYLAVAHATAPFMSMLDSTLSWGALAPPAITPTGSANAVAWSPDGSRLAVGHAVSPYLTIYDTATWAKISGPAVLPPAEVADLAWSPDGTRLACGGAALTIYDTSAWSVVSGAPAIPSAARALSWSVDGAKLAVALSAAPYLRIYNSATWGDTGTANALVTAYLNDIAWATSDTIILAGSAWPPLIRWNTAADVSEKITLSPGSPMGVAAVRYTPKAISGDVKDINLNGVIRTLRAYRRDTGELVGSAQSANLTGHYSISCRHAGEHTVVMFDDLVGTLENDKVLRTTPV